MYGCIVHQGSRRQRFKAFTLIELMLVVVILGILAAAVIPQFSNAAQLAREASLRDELRYLRGQIQAYRAHHRDVAPGYAGGYAATNPTEAAFVLQMTGYTDEDGDVSATRTGQHNRGPYLSRMPMNHVNGKATIQVIDDGQPISAPDDTTGWLYKPQTGEIFANSTGTDTDGKPFAEY